MAKKCFLKNIPREYKSTHRPHDIENTTSVFGDDLVSHHSPLWPLLFILNNSSEGTNSGQRVTLKLEGSLEPFSSSFPQFCL